MRKITVSLLAASFVLAGASLASAKRAHAKAKKPEAPTQSLGPTGDSARFTRAGFHQFFVPWESVSGWKWTQDKSGWWNWQRT